MLCRGKIRATQHEMHQMKNTGNYNTPHQKLNSYKKNKSERNVSMSTLDFDIKEKDMSMINDPLYDLNAMPLIHVSAEFMRFSGMDWVQQTEQLLAKNCAFILIYPELHFPPENRETKPVENEEAREARTVIAKWLRKHRDDFSARCKAIILCSSNKGCADNLRQGLERMYGVPVIESTTEQATLLAKEIMSIS